MASQESQEQPGKKKSRTLAVGHYLYTPPEQTADSFSHEVDDKTHEGQDWRNTLPPLQGRTPPASPETNTLPSLATATGLPTHDSPLYPEPSQDRARSQTPLFNNDRGRSPQRAQSTPSTGAALASSSGVVSHNSDSNGRSNVYPAILGITTGQQAMQYWSQCLDELKRMKTVKLPSPRSSSSSERDWLSTAQLHKVSRPTGVTKTRSAPKAATKPKATRAASPEKTSPFKRRTPKARTYNDFVDTAFPSAQSSTKHKRAPPSKKVEGENVSWTDLPDYAPPVDTLDSMPKSLKANWNGNPIDLSTDPDRTNCHPQEVGVAATLRLSCAQYLTNKRKIFQARLQALNDGKNFTKTAAQGACAIDVNKASQLWEAFDRVGWFTESWFQEHL